MNTVIFSTNKAPWGGSEDLWKKLCIDAKVLGFNVLASYIDHPLKHNHILELIDAGIAIQRRTPTSKHSNTSLTNLIKDTWVKKKNSNASGKVWREIYRFKPDQIIFNLGEAFEETFLWHYFTIEKLIQKKIKYKIIVHFNASEFPNQSKKDRNKFIRLYSNADQVFFVSNENAESTYRQLGLVSKKYSVVESQVEGLLNKKSSEMTNNGLLNLAFVARLNHDIKGHDIALDFISSYSGKKDVRINIYGTGASQNHIKNLIEFYSLSDIAKIHGFESDKATIWKNNDALFLTSKEEGLPLSLLEALHYKRTFICTPAGGISDLDTNYGFIIDLSHEQSFHKLLDNLKSDKGKLQEKALAGYNSLQIKKGKTYSETILI